MVERVCVSAMTVHRHGCHQRERDGDLSPGSAPGARRRVSNARLLSMERNIVERYIGEHPGGCRR